MALRFISHDLPVVAQVVDRVFVLQPGQLVEQGPVSTVLRNPSHPCVQGLLVAARSLHQALQISP
jgi:peptide/nickel transport system ATP-binding protein